MVLETHGFPWLRVLETHGFSPCFQGWVMLKDKIQKGGPLVLWAGWEGNYMANVVGNYPWFATMNVLQKHVTWRIDAKGWRMEP